MRSNALAIVAFVATIALSFFPRPALAASALLSVRAQSDGGTRVLLVFAGGVPPYRTYGNGSNDVTILLAGVTRAANLQVANGAKSTIADISVESIADDTQIVLHGRLALSASVETGSGASLLVSLTPANRSSVPAPAPFGLAPPPSSMPIVGNAQSAVVRLKYADVSEIVGLLVSNAQINSNDVFSPQQSAFSTQGFGLYGSAGQLSLPLQNSGLQTSLSSGAGGPLGQRITENIGVDRRLNAIVLRGTPQQIAEWKLEIAQLDVPLNGVALETQIVELTESAARDVGIDFTNGGGPIGQVQYNRQPGASAELSYSLQAAVYAQVAKGKGRIIARPRIVAADGTPASILTGDALPIVTSIAVSGVNAIQQQVQYVNIGVNLQISPRISSSGYVTSHIYSEVSSVTGYQQGYPIISQRQAQTLATVKDGEPFVIGGLIQQSELTSMSKIPLLGDLPIIGSLFKLQHNTSETTNLYIIVTPRIVHAGEEPAVSS